MKYKICNILFFYFFIGQCFSQTLSLKKYTVEDGLPSSYLYKIKQDKEGFIWITTEGGISKFDGISFNNTPIPKLASEEIIDIAFDQEQRIWSNILNGDIVYTEKDKTYKLEPFYHKKKRLQIIGIEVDSKNRVWLISKADVCIRIDSVYQNKIIHHKIFNFKNHSSKILKEINNEIKIFDKYGTYTLNKNTDEFNFKPFIQNDLKLNLSIGITSGVIIKDELIISSLYNIYSINLITNTIKPVFKEYDSFIKKGINSITIDKDNNFWICSKSGLLFLRKSDHGKYISQYFLKDHFVGMIFIDNNNSFWISTQKKGLYFLPSTQINIVNKTWGLSNDMVTSLNNYEDKIIVGCNDNSFNILSFNSNNQPDLIHSDRISKENLELYDIMIDHKGDTWFLSSFGAFSMKKGKRDVQKIPKRNSSYKIGEQAKDGSIWHGTSMETYKLENEKLIRIIDERTYALEPISKDEAWIGTVNGLYHYTSKKGAQAIEIAELKTDIRFLKMQGKDTLWVATKSKGLFVFHQNKIIHHFNADNNFPSNSCKTIFIHDNIAWIGTNNGIAKINLSDYSFSTININHGLPSREINDIIEYHNKIVVATNEGLACFNIDSNLKTEVPNLKITAIKINEKDTILQPSYTLKYADNNIKISFIGLAYHAYKNIQYLVQLEGLDKNWVQNNTGVVEYPSLNSGTYTLKIKAKAANSAWSEIKTIQIQILKPFWLQWWFIILFASIFFLLIYWIVFFIIKRIRNQNEIKEKIKESRLTALRTQMNPHFMFNSLNAIQEFIILQDKKSANKYLSSFSKLMRNILEMSDKNKISLEKEIETLNLYLSLENMRFDNSLNYSINIDNDLNPPFVPLPSMLIQPFVENAINHGLMHKKENKKLDVSFRKENDFLVCEIDDNGIGRIEAQKIKSKNKRTHQPKAMSVTRERLNLLNSAFKDKLSVKIIDKKEDNGVSRGTKVIIYIQQTCPNY